MTFTWMGNDGYNWSTNSSTVSITITPINDAPTGTNNTVTTLEDTQYTFTTANFGFGDASDSPQNTLQAVRITTLPGAGTLQLNSVNVTAGQYISAANITSGLLRFVPAANANGTSYASFTFQVQDNGGTANGGVNLDQSPNTMTVNVTSVNDAPTGTNNTVTALEDAQYTFTTADFGYSDALDSPENSLWKVKFTTLPAV